MHIPESDDGTANGIGAVMFSPNGQILAASEASGAVSMWDPANGQLLGSIPPENAGFLAHVTAVAFSPDGRVLAVSYSSGQVWVWNTGNWQLIGIIYADYKPGEAAGDLGVWGVGFSPDACCH
jgi:WD40 repeat protein